MNLVKKSFISLSAALLAVCFGLVLLSNWSVFGWRAMIVPTGSMKPVIPPGSLVLMHSVPNSSLKVGDVITYANPHNLKTTISHRIIKAYKIDNKVPAYITKGDANPAADPIPVVGGQVKGKIVGHVPYVGKWLTLGKGWPAITMMVYIPALILMIEEIRKLAEYFRRIKYYRAPGFKPHRESFSFNKMTASLTILVGILLSLLIMAPTAKALLASNVVRLSPNHLTVAVDDNPNPPPVKCQNTTNNTNINVNNNSNQTATSGDGIVTNNTNGGSATSGNASNSNSTSANINVNNNCNL